MRHETCAAWPSLAITAMASNRLWAHRPFQQLVARFGGGELRLELGDPPLGRHQLGELGAPQAGRLPTVDKILRSPVVDRLAAHAQIARDVGDFPARRDQIQDPAPELRWIALCHADLLTGSWA
jgi:hypothetical protein